MMINFNYKEVKQKMSINIFLKIRSLNRRGQSFHCLSYDWDSRQIIVHRTQQEYNSEISHLINVGLVKRAQCYYDQQLVLNNHRYVIYLISYGDFRKGKMVKGENPIAKSLGICLFDYVYLFIEQLDYAKQKMINQINLMEKRGEQFHRNLMINTFQNIYSRRFQFSFSQLKNKEKQQEKTEVCLPQI